MSERTWDVNVGGCGFLVSAAETENGLWAVRVDGRMAAKPLGGGDRERVIRVGGALYRLVRDDKGELHLELHELPKPASVPNHPATLIPNRIEEMPLGFTPTDVLRSPKILWAVVIALFAAMMWYALGPNYEKQAVARVSNILSDMSQGTGPEVQFAVGLWARNVKTLSDRDELSWASDHFDKWRMEKKLFRKFSSWEIVDSSMVEGALPPTALVTVKIEEKTYTMVVPERMPISWGG